MSTPLLWYITEPCGRCKGLGLDPDSKASAPRPCPRCRGSRKVHGRRNPRYLEIVDVDILGEPPSPVIPAALALAEEYSRERWGSYSPVDHVACWREGVTSVRVRVLVERGGAR